MPKNRAYKLNAQRQPGNKRGTFLYYYYDADGLLTCDELNRKLFDKLVKMDSEYYNLERRTKYHDAAHTRLSPHNHIFRPQKPEDLPDKKMDTHLSTYEEQADLHGMITQFHGDNKVIFRMYYLERKKQEVIAKFLGKTQSYVSKRLAKIKEVIELRNLKWQDQTDDEAYAERQWEKFLDKYRTDDDEDILFDMFRCICGSDLQEALLEWFYSYREYSKFCLQYLILRPFDKAKDGEFEERLGKLHEWQQTTYCLQFSEHMEKYHKTDIAPVENENERDEDCHASNPQIDFTRTWDNYNIIKRQRSYTQFINDKIEALGLPTKVRKDAVLMCSFVIGSDRQFFGSLSKEEQRQFFVDCTRFFAERYGEENIISAVVHMDETTPHLHLNLIPIANGRVCAKQLFDRKELQNLQSNFHSVVGKKWNLQRGKEGSQAKHLDTAAYKLKKMKEETAAAEERKAVAEQGALSAEQRQVHAEQETQQLEDRQKQLQRDTAPLQAAADVLQEYNNGKRKLNKRDLPIIAAEVAKLKTENSQLEERLQISARDQSDVFNLYQKTEREKQSLQSDADVLREIREHAPDKLQEVMETVRQRKLDKYRPKPFKSSGNHWSK